MSERRIISPDLGGLFKIGGFPRFLVVGLLNTLFGYGVFCLALAASNQAVFAAAVSTVLGVLFNFRTIGGLVFGSSDLRLIERFTGVYVLLFLLDACALEIAQRCGIASVVAQAGLVAPLAGLSFILNRAFVFGPASRNDA